MFRKHADPQFKSKSRFGNEPQMSDEKSKEKSEMVSCDVCSQMFPTISKAITHKHKVHPDHDVKYFCPWCGKLFTMKVSVVFMNNVTHRYLLQTLPSPHFMAAFLIDVILSLTTL